MLKVPTHWTRYQEASLRLLYPAFCGHCGLSLELEQMRLCQNCQQKFEDLQRPLDQAAIEDNFESLNNAWALFNYKGIVRDLLTRIKFSGKQWLVPTFKESITQIAAAICAEKQYAAVIPIPINLEKRLEREFNQAELFAELFCKQTGIALKPRLLTKKYSRPPQSRLGRLERLANTFGAFQISRLSKIKGNHFLVIDDILTTGATGEEAARALKTKGAQSVDLLAIAYAEPKNEQK